MTESIQNDNSLKTTFIAMLFALVVATLAQRFADLLDVVTGGWSVPIFSVQVFSIFFADGGLLLAPLTHVLLGLLLVSLSWVGWSNSQAAGHRQKISELLSYPFLLLLIEVTLVTVYFGIATSIELDMAGIRNGSGESTVVTPSAVPETLQLMAIFILYFFWDIVADVLSSPIEKEANSISVHPIKSFFTGVLTYASVSAISVLLCYIIFRAYPISPEPYHAVLGDFALMSVMAIFYVGKNLEGFVAKYFPWELTRLNSLRELPLTNSNKLKLISLSISYFVLVLLIWNPN